MAQQAIHKSVAQAIDLLDLGKLIRTNLDNFPGFEPTVEEQVRDALHGELSEAPPVASEAAAKARG